MKPKSVVLSLSAVIAAVLALLVGVSPAQAADPYTPDLPTSCKVSGTVGAADGRVTITAEVSANSATPPTGTVDLTVATGGAARRARAAAPTSWSTTVRYDGSPIRVRAPRLAGGRYVVTMSFRPDGELHRPCTASAGVTRGGVGGGGPQTGALPDTGGPDLMWLLLGGLLVAAGSASITLSRRTDGT